MMFRTHVLFGILCGLLALLFFDPKMPWVFFGFFVVGAMMPDIDIPNSKVGRRHRVMSLFTNFVFGHRGFIHTIYPALGLFVLFYVLGFGGLGFALFLGYFSHLILDMLTPDGIAFFYPLYNVRMKGFVHTAGVLEYLVQVFVIVGVVVVVRFGWF